MSRRCRFAGIAVWCWGVVAAAAAAAPAFFATAVARAQEADAENAEGDNSAPTAEQQAQIERLIAELGDADYETRDEAQRRLSKLGPLAFDALAAAEASPDVEVSRRATYLLRSIRIPWIREDDPTDVRQLLRNYGALDAKKRQERIALFAAMPSDVATDPLCRIVRYEKRSELAKEAALLIIDRPPPEGETLDRQRATIRRTLGASRRAAARWLLAYERFFAEPDAALAEWSNILDEETAALARRSSDADAHQVFRLRKRQHAMLVARGRADEAKAAVGKMVELVPANTERLVGFIEWLGTAQAWDAVDDLAKRHAALFERHPILVYALANAQLSAGRKEEAEETARRALAIRPTELIAHAEVAMRLIGFGLFAWAERECRFVIENSPQDSGVAIQVGILMASMLQDQAEYLKAAQASEAIVKRFDANPSLREQFEADADSYYTPRRIRAGMHYCYAMHYDSIGDRASQVEHLEKAVRADPQNADVLIALYRLSDQDEERRALTKRRIERAAQAIRIDIERREAQAEKDVADQELLAQRQNEYAWLVSNTFGDFDLALEYAVKSNEHHDNARGGLLDTLARCHYAKGDLDEAIRVQTRAVQLEPHSGAIARQLDFFRQEAEKRDAARQGDGGAEAAPRATEPD